MAYASLIQKIFQYKRIFNKNLTYSRYERRVESIIWKSKQ